VYRGGVAPISASDAWPFAWARVRQAWPRVALGEERFFAHVEAKRREGGAADEYLPDLYVACAAADGDAAALRIFDTDFLLPTVGAARTIDPSPAFLDELTQQLRVHLLVADRDGRPRIAAYRGGGPLAGFIRVAALRLALNLKRQKTPTLSMEEMLGELVSREPDPELRHLKDLYRAQFGEALRAALAALPERQRALLRLHYVDGLTLAQIGALYRVHESTASRWLSAAASAVADHARARLRERLAVSPSSLDSVARMVQSQLDLSIRTLLGDRTR
jgi:RNA polymerase sigma-70 factor (ECF subfamily)